jgi:hypothetical protein
MNFIRYVFNSVAVYISSIRYLDFNSCLFFQKSTKLYISIRILLFKEILHFYMMSILGRMGFLFFFNKRKSNTLFASNHVIAAVSGFKDETYKKFILDTTIPGFIFLTFHNFNNNQYQSELN